MFMLYMHAPADNALFLCNVPLLLLLLPLECRPF